MKKILPLGILIFSCISIFGQGEIPKTKLFLKTKSYKDKIVLRWAYPNQALWRKLNEEGFRIERITLDDKTNIPETDNFSVLEQSVKPWSRKMFEERVSVDDSLTIAAYALLYDTLNLENPENLLLSLKEKGDDERRRALFSFYLADQNGHAATALGLRYEDTDVEEGKKYVYRIYSNNTHNFVATDTAVAIVKKSEIRTLSSPVPPQIKNMDSLVILQWKPHPMYGQWHVERSDDGVHYKRITRAPVLENKENPFVADSISYADEHLQNNKIYMYRIVGIDVFGDHSPPSMAVPGKPKDLTAPNNPYVIKGENSEGLTVVLEWEHISTPDFKGFLVAHSLDDGNSYSILTPTILPPSSTTFTHKTADEFKANIYKIIAVDHEGNQGESFPFHAIIKNQAPPDPPSLLKGVIDSQGVVTVQWTPSKAMDVRGYVVYRANADHHRFIAMNGNKMVYEDMYKDTITLNTLSENIYYKVQAVDVHYAHSEDSEMLVLSKPDTVAPVSPVIHDYSVDENGVYLSWRVSSSTDVVSQSLLKTVEGNSTETITIDLNQTEYKDLNVEAGQKIKYQIIALDDANNYSNPSFPVHIKGYKSPYQEGVQNLIAEYDKEKKQVKLSWDFNSTEKGRFVVLKKSQDHQKAPLEYLSFDVRSCIDKKVEEGKTYQYSVAAFYKDGTKSKSNPTTELILPKTNE